MWTNAERAIRALRLRKGWTQGTLGGHANVSREMVSRLERGQLRGMTVGSVERVTEALGASLHLTIRWRGEQLDRLVDAAHAALQEEAARLLTAAGWDLRIEVSFNHFGDRGRIDLLACHPRRRVLLVVEIKSAIGDLQETLGRLDVKVRMAREIARRCGWTGVVAVVPALVVGDSRSARRVVAAHAVLFARFAVRGRAAHSWLRTPSDPVPSGLLWFANRSDSYRLRNTRVRRSPNRPDSRGV